MPVQGPQLLGAAVTPEGLAHRQAEFADALDYGNRAKLQLLRQIQVDQLQQWPKLFATKFELVAGKCL